MQDNEVRAIAQTMGTIARAYAREKKHIDENDLILVTENPARGFVQTLRKALAAKVLTPDDNAMIGVFMNELDGPLEEGGDEPLGMRQTANFWVLYYHWREVMTASEAAKELNVTKQRISALKKAGKLDYVTVDGRDYFTRASVTQRKIADEEQESAENQSTLRE